MRLVVILLVCAGCVAPAKLKVTPLPTPTAPAKPTALAAIAKPQIVTTSPAYTYIPLDAVPKPKQAYKPLPPLKILKLPGNYWLETSTDLVHWKALHFFKWEYLPTEIQYTPPKVGSMFLRFVCQPFPPESFKQLPLPPGLNVNQ